MNYSTNMCFRISVANRYIPKLREILYAEDTIPRAQHSAPRTNKFIGRPDSIWTRDGPPQATAALHYSARSVCHTIWPLRCATLSWGGARRSAQAIWPMRIEQTSLSRAPSPFPAAAHPRARSARRSRAHRRGHVQQCAQLPLARRVCSLTFCGLRVLKDGLERAEARLLLLSEGGLELAHTSIHCPVGAAAAAPEPLLELR